jgi:hypothetical protein
MVSGLDGDPHYRGAENDRVLPDPECYLAKRHGHGIRKTRQCLDHCEISSFAQYVIRTSAYWSRSYYVGGLVP